MRKIQRTVSLLNRNSLLPYKKFKKPCNDKTIFLKLPYDINFNLNNQAISNIKNYYLNHNLLKDYKIKIIYSIQPNISQYLIHSNKFFFFPFTKNSKCLNLECKTCFFIDDSINYININNFICPILSKGNCNSTNVIYFIKCTICDVFYIGETTNFKSRVRNHLSNIKNFIPFDSSNTCVSFHFNLSNHDYNKCLKFIIFKDKIVDCLTRFSFESQLINLFSSISNKLLNDKIPKNKGSHVPLFSIL